jgi:hypothetical protein
MLAPQDSDTVCIRASVIARWIDMTRRIGEPAEGLGAHLRAFNRDESRSRLEEARRAAQKLVACAAGRTEQTIAIVLVAEIAAALDRA